MKSLTLIDRKTWRRVALLAGLLVLLAIHPTRAKGQEPGRVFALLAIDTDSKIAGIEDDGRAMSAALASGFGSTGLLNLRVLDGVDVGPDAILNYFRNVRSGPNDVLLLYYTGHGATLEGRGHVLTTSHGNLLRGTLRAAMKTRQPRLSIILTDCCSSLVKRREEPPTIGAPPPTDPAPARQVSPILRCLLLRHRGVVDLTSSSYGEASWSSQGTGGLFTSALTHALGSWGVEPFDRDKDDFVTWTELFEHVRHETQAGFHEFKQELLNQDQRGLERGMLDNLKRQRDQVPQAFALGDPVGTLATQEYYAPNIGIHFRLVPVGDAAGACLTRNPDPGSGAALLRLEPGDTIYTLDSLPIREAVDVMNHHSRTDVVFINVRTQKPQEDVMVLPNFTPLPAEVPRENYAANLGIHYQLIPYDGDTFGARLSRTAYGRTPAATLQLERGDMIIRLDSESIRKPADLLAHVDRTNVEFINIHTGRMETRIVQLPGQVGASQSRRGTRR